MIANSKTQGNELFPPVEGYTKKPTKTKLSYFNLKTQELIGNCETRSPLAFYNESIAKKPI